MGEQEMSLLRISESMFSAGNSVERVKMMGDVGMKATFTEGWGAKCNIGLATGMTFGERV